MTTSEQAVTRPEENGSRSEGVVHVVACAFCRRRLADEYYFTCRRCGHSYCYIHTSRHQPAQCARKVERRLKAHATPSEATRVGVAIPNGNQLLFAGPPAGPKP